MSLLGESMLAHPLAVSADWNQNHPEVMDDPARDQFPDELEMFASSLPRERIDHRKIQELRRVAQMFRDRDSYTSHLPFHLPFKTTPFRSLTLILGETLREIPNASYQRAVSHILSTGLYAMPTERDYKLFGWGDKRPFHIREVWNLSIIVSTYNSLMFLYLESVRPFHLRGYGDALYIAGSEKGACRCYRRAAEIWMAEAREIFNSRTDDPKSIYWMDECLRRAREMLVRVGESPVASVDFGI